jgi:undecaprenyl-diphosphatase
MRRHVRTFDRIMDAWIKSFPKWLHMPMTVISFLGQPVVTGGIAALVAGIGYGRGNDSLMTAGLVVLGTMAIGSVLKLMLKRNRPVTEYVERMLFHTFSFPSGHAAGSAPAYGLLSYLLLSSPQPTGNILAAVLALLIVLIGISRVYLGAHYTSDVLGGWLVGFSGLAVIILIVKPMV